MSKFLDYDGLLYFWQKMKSLLAGKVDKDGSKVLSSNDFTDEYKRKLDEGEGYTLPIASESDLGGIKVGGGLSITPEGVLSANETDLSDYAKKSDITNIYRYKGSKENYASLPQSGNEIGDVWNVESTDMNYAWNGSAWDPLGQVFEITSISNEEINGIVGVD